MNDQSQYEHHCNAHTAMQLIENPTKERVKKSTLYFFLCADTPVHPDQEETQSNIQQEFPL